jgi:hypothetical protein
MRPGLHDEAVSRRLRRDPPIKLGSRNPRRSTQFHDAKIAFPKKRKELRPSTTQIGRGLAYRQESLLHRLPSNLGAVAQVLCDSLAFR